MATIFKTLLLLVILAFEDANGRPPTKGMTDGKFVNSQQSVTKDRYLLNTKRICFVCQSEVYLFKILSVCYSRRKISLGAYLSVQKSLFKGILNLNGNKIADVWRRLIV